METPILDVAFGPPAADWALLSKAHRRTLQVLYRHPIAHNLEWTDVVSLFETLGTVEQKSHNEVMFGIGGEHHAVRRPHSKDVTVEELLEFRRILTHAGWSPSAAAEAETMEAAAASTAPDLLVVVEHHEARIYHLDLKSADAQDQVIKPHDPHHFLNHLTHKDMSRQRGQRAPEDLGFYTRIAAALVPAHAIVVIGHGDGHSNAANRLVEFLRQHHPETSGQVTSERVKDLSSVTPPQLLAIGRRALSPGATG